MGAKPSVFVTRQIPDEALKTIKKYYDVEVWPYYTPPSKDALLREARESDALVTVSPPRSL